MLAMSSAHANSPVEIARTHDSRLSLPAWVIVVPRVATRPKKMNTKRSPSPMYP